MNKTYLPKVYRRNRTTVNQYVYDGDFEGFDSTTTSTYWASTGTPTLASRNRNTCYPADVKKAIVLDGTTSYVQTPSVGQTGNSFGTPTINFNTMTFSLVLTKTSWNDGVQQVIVDCIPTGWANTTGFSLDANVTTAGKLTAKVSLNSVLKSVDYSLSSMTSGRHQISFGSDGRFVRLWVDGVQVNQFDNVSTVTVTAYGSKGVYVGCKRNEYGGANPASLFTTGTLGSITMYNTLLTSAQLLQIWQTNNPQSTNCMFHYDMHNKIPLNPPVSTASYYALAENNANYGIVYYGTSDQVDSPITKSRSMMITTSTSGSALQGISQASGKECQIVGGATYTASAYVNAPNGTQMSLIITPTGGGSPQTTTITANGTWQKITANYASNALATKLSIAVVMQSAATSAQTFYIDKIAVNNGATAYDYFDQNTSSVGNSVYGFTDSNQANTGTFTSYTYIKNWGGEVISDFGYEHELNSAGSKIDMTLARDPTNFGERVDIDFGNEVRIYCIDDQAPNGKLIFTGYIADYTPDLVANNVKVQIYSYGEELSNYMVQSGPTMTAQMPIDNGALASGSWGNAYAITINPTVNMKLSTVYLNVATQFAASGPFSLALYKGTPASDSLLITGGAVSYVTTNSATATTNSVTLPVGTAARTAFSFSSSQTLYSGQKYYLLLYGLQDTLFTLRGATAASDAVNALNYPPIGALYSATNPFNNTATNMTTNGTGYGAYVELWTGTGSTTAPYLSMDPSDILKDVLNNYSQQGGNVTYDTDSIQPTGQVVSYTFNSSTVFDALKKCLELAPANWYFYIDHATKKVNFKLKSEAIDHTFLLGKHLEMVTFDERSEDIINTVDLTGGDIGGGVNLYRRYQNSGSVALYGQRLQVYIDNRITRTDTADTIATNIIAERKMPEVRANISILDGTYDIESILQGQIVSFGNIGNSSDYASTWDAGYWDEAYWDFDISNQSTLQIQIAKMTYTPDKVTLTLSTVPPDVNKRIEDINRNLEAQQTINNPNSPTAVTS